jgi:hypothetical protein
MNANGNLPLRSRLRAYFELFLVVLLMMLLAALSVRAEEHLPPVALGGAACGSLSPEIEPGFSSASCPRDLRQPRRPEWRL